MGVSFAIPINIVKNVTVNLKSTGYVSRGWLGVAIQGIDDNLAQSLGLSNSKGSLVSSISENSPAAKAGLQVGDVILEFDNKTVNAVSDLPILVGNTPIGKSVPVAIIRKGAEKTLNVTVDKLKTDDEEPVLAALEKGSLGVAVSALSDEEKATLSDKNQGVKVEQVLADSAAENAGLQSGDIILSVAGKSIESPANLKAAIQAADSNKPLAILLKRGDQSIFVAVNLNS
jgi:serine protease Do